MFLMVIFIHFLKRNVMNSTNNILVLRDHPETHLFQTSGFTRLVWKKLNSFLAQPPFLMVIFTHG